MIGFEYKFKTSNEIISSIKLLSEYSFIEYTILIGLIIFIIILIYYILPIFSIFLIERKKDKEKEKKEKMLKQILIQNKVAKEIEKEVNFH